MLIHRSPAFTAIYNEISNSDRNRILDLGPMSGGCFQLFSQLSCKIQVEDLASFITEQIEQGVELESLHLDDYLADYTKDEKFDVVFAWDLFNYLSLAEIEKLFAKLRPHCKPDTLLYMMRYVEKQIPYKPREFRVKDKYLLEVSELTLNDRKLPNYSTLQLLSSMPGYFMQDTMLSQMGMLPGVTEHVLRFSPSYESRHLISKSESRVAQRTESDRRIRIHQSPAIAEVLSLLQSDDNFVVLDLGSSTNRGKDSIVENAGAYYRADIYSLIERSRVKKVEELNLSILDYQISRKFDVILAWDIFNYCTPNQLKQLNRALSALCHENTFLLSFIYTGRSQPAKPSRFEVMEGKQIRISSTLKEKAQSQSMTGAALLRLLQGFRMDDTFAYRVGMDRDILEYIFYYHHNDAAASLNPLENVV